MSTGNWQFGSKTHVSTDAPSITRGNITPREVEPPLMVQRLLRTRADKAKTPDLTVGSVFFVRLDRILSSLLTSRLYKRRVGTEHEAFNFPG